MIDKIVISFKDTGTKWNELRFEFPALYNQDGTLLIPSSTPFTYTTSDNATKESILNDILPIIYRRREFNENEKKYIEAKILGHLRAFERIHDNIARVA